jgi:molybdenum cofactor cytidylyltransferase
MQLCTLALADTIGHIVCHNLADRMGRKAYPKGHVVRPADLPGLASLGLSEIRVAVLDPDDVHEDNAAQRLAAALAGPNVVPTTAHTGRVNLRSTCAGPLHIDADALLAINELDGLTVATLPNHTLVRAEQTLATIKVIPFAVPEARLAMAEERAAHAAGVLQVCPLTVQQVGVILVSSPAAEGRIERSLYPAIERRVQALAGTILAWRMVAINEAQIAQALHELEASGAELVIIAGETSIIDIDDVIPEGIRRAGGRIEHYGAPVEPGNLLLLGYLEQADKPTLPVLGAPGCVRSRDANIVDLILPRLMAGEQLQRRDIVAMGMGGLLG